jgi:hypothetical protein
MPMTPRYHSSRDDVVPVAQIGRFDIVRIRGGLAAYFEDRCFVRNADLHILEHVTAAEDEMLRAAFALLEGST